jgi:hypothetical protein
MGGKPVPKTEMAFQFQCPPTFPHTLTCPPLIFLYTHTHRRTTYTLEFVFVCLFSFLRKSFFFYVFLHILQFALPIGALVAVEMGCTNYVLKVFLFFLFLYRCSSSRCQ